MRINATRALDALGIRHPVRFVSVPEITTSPTAEAGVNPGDPSIIQLNLRRCARHSVQKFREILAHELVHVRQMQDIGDPWMAHDLYVEENRKHGYTNNRFELEAEHYAPAVADLIEVTA